MKIYVKWPNQITAHNAGWPSQFRFAGSVFWPGVCEFCRLMSPGMYRPKSLAALQVQYAQAPSLELERRIEKQQASLRISRYLLFGSVIIVGLGMVGYAKYRRL